ncbi:hypothetical protein CCH79_00011862 [Gambusia affinis]|uniref:Coiled-coil domain-containing protein 90B, mitochondrial n=1 Tax=Gambusia affinis TaxID=33528 RepID=A0A315VLJ0_GAMAF|nr:hypothetical protein CCH79_00011862 [Gambusia affinis]
MTVVDPTVRESTTVKPVRAVVFPLSACCFVRLVPVQVNEATYGMNPLLRRLVARRLGAWRGERHGVGCGTGAWGAICDKSHGVKVRSAEFTIVLLLLDDALRPLIGRREFGAARSEKVGKVRVLFLKDEFDVGTKPEPENGPGPVQEPEPGPVLVQEPEHGTGPGQELEHGHVHPVSVLCQDFRFAVCVVGFHVGTPFATFDLRKVELTPLEQRKLTFDSHAMVTELEKSGFEKRQAELIVSALVTLTTANMDIVYKDMVTKSHQEIAVQQIMAHLDSIRKDMVILEKSEFANLRSENTKMKRELEQLQNRLKEESEKVRAETKLDINLERSRTSDMVGQSATCFDTRTRCSLSQFTDQEKKLMEATSDFYHKKADLENDNMEINKKMDLQVASLKMVLESLKLETIRYMAATIFACLAIALGVYRFWR